MRNGQGFFLTAELLSDDRFGGGGPDDRRMHAVDRLKKVDENMFLMFGNKIIGLFIVVICY